jgi:hypothetical protein
MESHGKFVWMLRSFSDKPTQKVDEQIEVIEETVEE